MNEWKEVKLNEFIVFNPKETIKKGKLSKKIAMDKLEPYNKFLSEFEITEFKGGSKFKNGDTLLARITPCLENGKTCKVNILENDEIGFGSTEFIVLRKIENISDEDFIYYLAISPKLRDIAIKSMTGTSGRQRVQQNALENLEINLPSLPEQKAIAQTLSCLDEKIELNNKINKTLEEMAQAIFKKWFIDFDYPLTDDEIKQGGREFVDSELGKIPKGWKVVELEKIASINYGKNLPKKLLTKEGFSVFGGNGIIGKYNKFLYETSKILVSCRGENSGNINFSIPYSYVTNNSLVIDLFDEDYTYFYKYYFLFNNFKNYRTGSAQPQVTIENIKGIKILLPQKNLVIKFRDFYKNIFKEFLNIFEENEKLKEIRDTLLPKLINGEIRVPIK